MFKQALLSIWVAFAIPNSIASIRYSSSLKAINYVEISEDFLKAVKAGHSTLAYIDTLKKANENELADELNSDAKRIAFWLNIYNGFTQVILQKDPDQYKTRNSFFSIKKINIAGKQLSLDNIEHGILRRSKIKWSEGFVGDLFSSAFEKRFRVDTLDFRIHFALNCGAKSCPAIDFYEPARIDKQLNNAIKNYLNAECKFYPTKNIVYVPALMSWFRHDFGGKKNMLVILKKYDVIPRYSNPAIHFEKYDWTLFLNNFIEIGVC